MASADPLVSANDKLLKALITILAFKDEHLLDELRIVFAAAAGTESPIAGGGSAIWSHIRNELKMIGDLVDEMERHEIASPGAKMH